MASARGTIRIHRPPADVFAFLDAELGGAAVGLDFPMLVARLRVDGIDGRDFRDEARVGQPAGDGLALLS